MCVCFSTIPTLFYLFVLFVQPLIYPNLYFNFPFQQLISTLHWGEKKKKTSSIYNLQVTQHPTAATSESQDSANTFVKSCEFVRNSRSKSERKGLAIQVCCSSWGEQTLQQPRFLTLFQVHKWLVRRSLRFPDAHMLSMCRDNVRKTKLKICIQVSSAEICMHACVQYCGCTTAWVQMRECLCVHKHECSAQWCLNGYKTVLFLTFVRKKLSEDILVSQQKTE